MALYHTHRPQQFSDLIGQDHIRTTLLNALTSGTVGHAYLFSGPPGLGKTTTARLLAKAVNCKEVVGSRYTGVGTKKDSDTSPNTKYLIPNTDSEPCNTCPTCIAITKGNALDVLEIDAASNRGIDEIRGLREHIKFPPSVCAKKVIIIDEVHMLTKEAFNALLKTLEEPPMHCMFILATTEPHKVPATILSRVQQFNFIRATEAMLADHIMAIAKTEKKKIDADSAALLASLAEGSFRDAVMLFDQVSSGVQSVDSDRIRAVIGLSSITEIQRFFGALEKCNRTDALAVVDDFFESGGDPGVFIAQALGEARKRLRLVDTSHAVAWINGLIHSLGQLKSSPSPRLPLELFIAEQTATHQADDTPQIDTITPPAPETAHADHTVNTPRVVMKDPVDKKIPIAIQSTPTPQLSDESWHTLIRSLRDKNASLAALLEGSHIVSAIDGKATIAVSFAFHKNKIASKTNLPLVEAAITQIAGSPYIVECIIDPSYVKKRESQEYPDLVDEAVAIFEGA
ncbi:DNA polymerase III subunit gamma/tau [Candidatus Berkelbacteria bacterium]|nr:DNA polymerase III subunit gamma/tau [Candidatus Berkelbacteria bacterium]OIP07160.1 MAG: DNA polymerase III, subunit gamma and tau [Candidatus Berkelbacteria bacterium CG2_30_43_20]PIU87236.1 MAG: DNA polymerase III, subunit gamma and tau [Candidatus Berkelbacteria bacterium CG06_land_8_20_14_3_00_43_10]